ncbi:MAG: acetate--CoA ligase family protein, partial [Ignavibacteriae bacterium]|nr:acetate--CoA ligase family protein [Ignavibacteriota bacterium]
TSIILITAGFGETGEAGKKLEKKLIERIQSNRIRLVGPNCMGIINTLDEIKLNATFVAEKPEKGGIGFLSQSGALGAAVLNSLRETNIKFAHFVSVGNKIDITENDILKFWLKDKNINVLTFYLESIERGIEFISDFRNSAKKKPIIILKAGKTESGMKAASSHTGALSNNDRIINSLFKQFGIIRAENLNEMFNTAKGFEFFPLPKGNRIAVITNAGGPAILAVDKIENRNLKLAEITESTKNKLKKIVHPEGSINNPIDLLPGGTPEVYKNVNEIVLKDKNVDAVISVFVEPVMVNAFNVIESVNSIISPKPIYQVCMPLPEFWQKYNIESQKRKPIFRNPEDPAEIISNILLYQDKKKSNQKINIKIKSKDLNTSKGFLNQNEVKKISKKYNLPLVHQSILTLKQIKAKKDFTFPLVIKGLHPQVIHKSELNAVKTNIMNKKQLVSSANKIINSFQNKGYELSEFLIQPFIQIKHELLIGGFRDFSFGPIIMFGTGGKYVETLNDTQIRSAYLNDNDIDEMI